MTTNQNNSICINDLIKHTEDILITYFEVVCPETIPAYKVREDIKLPVKLLCEDISLGDYTLVYSWAVGNLISKGIIERVPIGNHLYYRYKPNTPLVASLASGLGDSRSD